jgi:hypothetical protein
MPELPPMRTTVVPERALGSGERTGMGVTVLMGEPFDEINHLVVLLLV